MLSICVPVYNHEKYIEKALNSIFMQKTSYTYEVLVGEDCSTDNTKRILEKYVRKHNYNNLHVFYRLKNMYNSRINNVLDLKLKSKGKYIITLEGDDYWIDTKKIEKQIRFLENNRSYIAVCHNCLVVDSNGNPTGEKYPECKDSEYTLNHFANMIMPGQTATIMYRNIYIYPWKIDMSLLFHKNPIGDRRLYLTLVTNGKIRCLQQKMSAYRHIVDNGSSFSATNKCFDFEKTFDLAKAYLKYSKRLNNKESIIASELFLLHSLRGGIRSKQVPIELALRMFHNIDYKPTLIRDMILSDITNLVFHSERKPIIL